MLRHYPKNTSLVSLLIFLPLLSIIGLIGQKISWIEIVIMSLGSFLVVGSIEKIVYIYSDRLVIRNFILMNWSHEFSDIKAVIFLDSMINSRTSFFKVVINKNGVDKWVNYHYFSFDNNQLKQMKDELENKGVHAIYCDINSTYSKIKELIKSGKYKFPD